MTYSGAGKREFLEKIARLAAEGGGSGDPTSRESRPCHAPARCHGADGADCRPGLVQCRPAPRECKSIETARIHLIDTPGFCKLSFQSWRICSRKNEQSPLERRLPSIHDTAWLPVYRKHVAGKEIHPRRLLMGSGLAVDIGQAGKRRVAFSFVKPVRPRSSARPTRRARGGEPM